MLLGRLNQVFVTLWPGAFQQGQEQAIEAAHTSVMDSYTLP